MIWSHGREKKKSAAEKEALRTRTLQADILRLAEEKGGKLTVVEVMAGLAVDKEAAGKALDALVGQEVAEIELTDSGVVVDAFYDIGHLKEKAEARGVLDA